MSSRHRHLDYSSGVPVSERGPAAIDDVLEGGDLADWAPLARAIRDDPRGEVAEIVLRICEAHPMYGTSVLWRSWIERLRGPARTVPGLAALRRSRGMTQQDVADRLGISQSDVSKLERRMDVRLGTLRAFVRATSGRLRVFAEYADEAVEIDL